MEMGETERDLEVHPLPSPPLSPLEHRGTGGEPPRFLSPLFSVFIDRIPARDSGPLLPRAGDDREGGAAGALAAAARAREPAAACSWVPR